MTPNPNVPSQAGNGLGGIGDDPAEPKTKKARKKEFRCGPLLINFAERTVNIGDHQVKLTGTEYALLCVLAEGAGKVVTQRQIVRKIWGGEFYGKTACLRVYASSLRKKLRNPLMPEVVLTEPGIGYRLAVLD